MPNGKVHSHRQPRKLSRRAFLQLISAASLSVLLPRCKVQEAQPAVQPTLENTETAVPPTPTATAVPSSPTSTAVPATPTATLTPTPIPTSTLTQTHTATTVPSPTTEPTAHATRVAIGKAQAYDTNLVRSAVRDMVDSLGGLRDVVRPGDRVAIKTNLTGGTGSARNSRFNPVDAYLTHPAVVRALGELVLDAGAKALYIVEAVYEWNSYVVWGYEDLASSLSATLIDLNATAPYDDYATVSVPGGGSVYPEYIFNHILQDVDVFMSVAKMKCHWTAGVTHSMKNLFGLVPARFYRLSDQHSHRSEFHGPTEETAGYRVPRIIVDLNKARPIDFALIDGIITIDGGEGPWVQTYGSDLLTPGLLIAGRDPVATDAVAVALQDFNPEAQSMTVPFVRSDNHLQLAVEAGLGTNRLSEIGVIGPSIDDVKLPFRACVV